MHIIFSADPSNIRFIPSATYYSLPSGSFMPLVMCMADCNTNCTYKWTKNRIDIAGQILRVYKISSSSAGTYTCTASEGTKVVMKSLLLDVPCKYTVLTHCIQLGKSNKIPHFLLQIIQGFFSKPFIYTTILNKYAKFE